MHLHNKLFLSETIKSLKSLNSFRTIGAIGPSSEYLASRMARQVDMTKMKCIVELGAGTGVLTKALLKAMRSDAILLSFEINQKFCDLLKNINDNRLNIIEDSAEYIEIHLDKFGFTKADCIFSGIPLVCLPKVTAKNIIHSVYQSLQKGGDYIQFQYSLTTLRKFKRIFNEVKIELELRNIPPAWVYKCRK